MDNDSTTQPLPEDSEFQPKPKPWGKLISVNPIYENMNLYNNSYSFGRAEENDVVVQDSRISKVHCRLFVSENGDYMLQDFSNNGTFLEDSRLMKGEKRKLKQGDRFFIMHYSKVPRVEVFGFIFALNEKELTFSSKISAKNQEKKVWGRLTSFNMQIDPIDLSENSYTIGRDASNDICIPHVALSKTHCKIYRNEKNQIIVEDFSTNGTFIEDDLIGKQSKKRIKSGEQLSLIHKKRIEPIQAFGFVFSEIWEDSVLTKRKLDYVNLKSEAGENEPDLRKRFMKTSIKKEFIEKLELQQKINLKSEYF